RPSRPWPVAWRSTTPMTAWAAMAASTALPQCSSMVRAAPTASGLPPATFAVLLYAVFVTGGLLAEHHGTATGRDTQRNDHGQRQCADQVKDVYAGKTGHGNQ